MLLTLATGTGKTVVAFQICWKLTNSRWNRTGEYRRPRILYLADRNVLIDDPKDKIFAPFGEARHKIEGEAIKSREMYFAIYQALAKDERRPGLYREYGQILNDSKVFVQPPPGAQGRTSLLQDGDLMLVITGATVGRVSVFRKALEPGLVSQHVAICRLPQSEVYPDYVLWGLRGPVGQAQLLGKKYGQGKPGLNLANIRSLSLPFPPVAEQQRIVADLDIIQTEVDRVKPLQTETATELEALLPAILSKAFREGLDNVVG